MQVRAERPISSAETHAVTPRRRQRGALVSFAAAANPTMRGLRRCSAKNRSIILRNFAASRSPYLFFSRVTLFFVTIGNSLLLLAST